MQICIFSCSVLSVTAAGGSAAQRGFCVCSARQTTIAIIILGHLQGHRRPINTTCGTQGLQNLYMLAWVCKIPKQRMSNFRKVSNTGDSDKIKEKIDSNNQNKKHSLRTSLMCIFNSLSLSKYLTAQVFFSLFIKMLCKDISAMGDIGES